MAHDAQGIWIGVDAVRLDPAPDALLRVVPGTAVDQMEGPAVHGQIQVVRKSGQEVEDAEARLGGVRR